MHEERRQRLADFAAWVKQYVKGDEKGEAQIFLDHLFQAFGLKGVQEAGAVCEERIKKADAGGTAFADLVWKPVVLIEMKRRGEDLRRHYRQAFDYWTRLVPGRPRYAVLCNFDEFWVYDFETQMDTPVDQVAVEELPARWGPLAFLFPNRETPTFGNDQAEVTRRAANLLATCFNKIIARKVDRALAQRFILQILVALFSEDIGLLEQYLVTRLLDDCKEPKDSFDLLGGLFAAMNAQGGMSGGRFKGVAYFNGGIFAEPARLDLYPDEIAQLRQAAKSDWSKVRPEIFGTIFEHSTDKPERHAFGAHFTSPVDIMKIVGPTIVEPWREQIEGAKSVKRLKELRQRMHHFTVLDPACGSGNFLYIAYRELKRLEVRIHERLREMSAKEDPSQLVFGFVTASNFFGLDINPFAVELAKVTLMIARKLAIDELHISEHALPLDNLDANFLECDALIDSAGQPTTWPKADVIIGNPPFLGAKRLKPERGPDYVNAVRRAYPNVPGMADYCVYWLRKAHDHLSPCTAEDPVAGRAGLVGTQNIRNNQSRVGGLDHIAATGTIIEAVDNQPWSGEANVHVSIVDWVKTQDAPLLPEKRRLWSKVDISPPLLDGTPIKPGRSRTVTAGKRGAVRKDKSFELDSRECGFINSALSDQADVSGAKVLAANVRPQRCFQGVVTGYKGFVLSKQQRQELLLSDPNSKQVVRPYLVGRDLVSGSGRPTRFVIDFDSVDIYSAQHHEGAFLHVKRRVLPEVQESAQRAEITDMAAARKQHLDRWWQFWNVRKGLRTALKKSRRYMACPRVTKRPIFCFVARSILPDNAIEVFAFPDDYSFGILQSNVHWQWFVAKCSKLKSDFRYTPESVFDTFPWPQKPGIRKINAVAAAGREVRRVRDEAIVRVKGGLRAVYRTLELPGKNPLKDAHAALDAAVLDAYGFSARNDLLAQLLALNLDIAARIDAGRAVTPPGIPDDYPNPARLVTDDCVTAE